MADAKKKQSSNEEGQNQHLGLINQQLQTYLMAQYQNQQEITRQLQQAQLQGGIRVEAKPEMVQPSPELADYLFAQSLLKQHNESVPQQLVPLPAAPINRVATADPDPSDLRADGMQEVFGNHGLNTNTPQTQSSGATNLAAPAQQGIEVNAFRIAYSKLPMVLRNRKFGRSYGPTIPAATTLAPSQNPAIY